MGLAGEVSDGIHPEVRSWPHVSAGFPPPCHRSRLDHHVSAGFFQPCHPSQLERLSCCARAGAADEDAAPDEVPPVAETTTGFIGADAAPDEAPPVAETTTGFAGGDAAPDAGFSQPCHRSQLDLKVSAAPLLSGNHFQLAPQSIFFEQIDCKQT